MHKLKKQAFNALLAAGAAAMLLPQGLALAAGKTVQSAAAAAPARPQGELPRMEFLGKFSAGVPGAGIYKLLDKTDGVVCYVLMPDAHHMTKTPAGILYESNGLGSISCLKVRY